MLKQDAQQHPSLLHDQSFWAILLTQFLGAFNDNVYKQTLLLLFVAVPWGVDAAGKVITQDFQGIASLVFAIPFLLFSGYAGYLADRYQKPYVILLCKVAELAIMIVGLGLFLVYDRLGMSLEMGFLFGIVLFAMGSHSAFFGPPKYGVLPELFSDQDLPKANGLILMTTFLAIIFGTVLAGGLMDAFPKNLSVIGMVCIAIALAGIGTSLMFRKLPAAQPGHRFNIGFLGVPREMRALLRSDTELHLALWMSSVFWMMGVLSLTALNALGTIQFEVSKTQTGYLAAATSGGIALGSVLAGVISQGRFHTGVLKSGAWGLFLTLLMMAIPGPNHGQLLGYWGSLVCMLLMGISTGLFAVPLQVLMQVRPPRSLKGQMMATMNLLNWSGIVLGGILYQIIASVLAALQLVPSNAFWVMAAIMGAVAILYRPGRAAALQLVTEHEA